MRTVFCILILFLILCSCNKQQEKDGADLIYYRVFKRYGEIRNDTVTLKTIRRHHPKDSLVGSESIIFRNRTHTLKMYTNLYADDLGYDAGKVEYELDNLGIIYGKSLTWEGYGRLMTHNDSLNEIIDIAIEHIIAKRAMHEEIAIKGYR